MSTPVSLGPVLDTSVAPTHARKVGDLTPELLPMIVSVTLSE